MPPQSLNKSETSSRFADVTCWEASFVLEIVRHVSWWSLLPCWPLVLILCFFDFLVLYRNFLCPTLRVSIEISVRYLFSSFVFFLLPVLLRGPCPWNSSEYLLKITWSSLVLLVVLFFKYLARRFFVTLHAPVISRCLRCPLEWVPSLTNAFHALIFITSVIEVRSPKWICSLSTMAR